MRFSKLRYETPLSLSGGQKQRLAIAASALVSQRDTIIFDEPTSGLDLQHMKELNQNIITLAEQGKTILVITHDLECILTCCTPIIQMDSGKIVKNYPLDRSSVPRLLEFFGCFAKRLSGKVLRYLYGCNSFRSKIQWVVKAPPWLVRRSRTCFLLLSSWRLQVTSKNSYIIGTCAD